MQRKLIVLMLVLSLLLAGCGTLEVSFDVTPASAGSGPQGSSDPAGTTPEPAARRLSMDSTSDEIYTAMLESALNWNTIWMDGTVTDYTPEGSVTSIERHEVWIDQINLLYRLLWGPQMTSAIKFKVGNAQSQREMDLMANGLAYSSPVSLDASASRYIPPRQPGTAYPNPIGSHLGDRLAALAFSSDFAQNEGNFTPVAIELIVGRQALVVDWTYIQNTDPSWRLWLDVDKAVILKMQTFNKTGGGPLTSELQVNAITFDADFGPDVFDMSPATPPDYGDIYGSGEQRFDTGPSGMPDPLGEVYFYLADRGYPERHIDLVRLPGSCVAGLLACPAPEIVDTPFDFKFSVDALVWSPDSSRAAVTYPSTSEGSMDGLYIFDPVASTWNKLVEFPIIDPPYWSPDLRWLAFREQDGHGNETLYRIRSDGSLLMDVSDLPGLPQDEQPFILHGWLGDNMLLSSAALGKESKAYRVRADDGYVEPLFEALQTKALYTVSPNGQWMAYYDYSESQQYVKLLKPGGMEIRNLAAFASGSVQAPTWSPDNSKLGFIHLDHNTNSSEVYVVNPDGSNLQPVFSSDAFFLSFSPDGNYLMVEGNDGSGQRLVIVNLATLDQRLIGAPGLPLDADWMMASWRTYNSH